ncbi:MAG: hypothetical protein JO036_15725 [Candidatus Eremiobacteraeota bacterium]|nr:hypothetical protein [Candidatus Eremiobacteraeota bacterium]
MVLGLLVLCGSTAGAGIGSVAKRGDNCTPIDSFAIGFPVPGQGLPGSSIVNEAVILANGWDPVAWILTSRDGRLVLAALHASKIEKEEVGTPPVIGLPSMSASAIRSTYNSFRTGLMRHGIDKRFVYSDELKSFTVSPCFAVPLPKGA